MSDQTRPDISLFLHVQQRKRALADQIASLKTIYLDTNYWIWLEKAALGKPEHFSHLDLLTSIRDRVERGSLICPTTESTILEFVLRHPPSRQEQPLAIVQELSRNVSLLPIAECLELEVELLLTAPDSFERPLVWIMSSYVFGETHPIPNSELFDGDAQLKIQKSFFDYRWKVPLAVFMTATGGIRYDERPDLHSIADEIDCANKRHSAEGRNLAEFLTIERRGISDKLAEYAQAVVARSGYVAGAQDDGGDTLSWNQLFAAALTTEKGKTKLASAHILASLHGARRANRTQRANANDVYDYNHAASAIGYCDAFFCERGLAEAIRRAGLLNGRDDDCFVTCDVTEAVEFVRRI